MSSTLLASRALFTEVRFDEALPRHQDWDWLLRAEAHTGAVVRIHPEPLVVHTNQPVGQSISHGGSWQTSLAWIEASADLLTPRQQGDLIACVTVPLAAHLGQWRALPALCRRAARLGAAPAAWIALVADCLLTLQRRRRTSADG